MSKHNAVECYLQLLVSDYKDKDDFLIVDKELCEIFTKNSFQICKSVIKLDDIAVILELCNIERINFNVFMIFRNCRAV